MRLLAKKRGDEERYTTLVAAVSRCGGEVMCLEGGRGEACLAHHFNGNLNQNRQINHLLQLWVCVSPAQRFMSRQVMVLVAVSVTVTFTVTVVVQVTATVTVTVNVVVTVT